MQKVVCLRFIDMILNKSSQQLLLTETGKLPLIALKTSSGTELPYKLTNHPSHPCVFMEMRLDLSLFEPHTN